VVNLMTGGWMEVTIISHSVEISIAGRVEETEDVLVLVESRVRLNI